MMSSLWTPLFIDNILSGYKENLLLTPYIQGSGCQEDPLDIEPSSEAFLKF